MASEPDLLHRRLWRGRDDGEDSIHTLGNGRIVAWCRGPDLEQVRGPAYTGASVLSLRLASQPGMSAVSSRESGAAIWLHRIDAGGAQATIREWATDGEPVLVRRIETAVPLVFELDMPAARPRCIAGHAGLGAQLAAGAAIYGDRFRSQRPTVAILAFDGPAVISERSGGDSACWRIEVGHGATTMVLAIAGEEPDAVMAAERALADGAGSLLGRARAFWAAETATRHLPALHHEETDAIAAAADDVHTLIAAQQGAEGGVMAGKHYPMAYVRDQFGVARGLLAMGLTARARSIMAFYWDVFRREGRVHNAQSVGLPATVFHVHENDDVEMTALLVIQAFELLQADGDEAFTRTLWPMLEWLIARQRPHLVGDMLPFSGDETYIAGGMVPRLAMDHGSAESTLLFIAAAQRFTAFAARHGLWPASRIDELRGEAMRVAGAYRGNFLDGARLLANNPDRAQGLALPRFRHGVCQGSDPGTGRWPGCRSFGWNELHADGLHYCPSCHPQAASRQRGPYAIRHHLPSVALAPLWIGHPIGRAEEESALVEDAIRPFLGDDGGVHPPTGRSLPGYELGVALRVLAGRKDPRGSAFAKQTLRLLDSAGAWAEYYDGDRPCNCRCRPWESGISIDALIRYAATP